MPAALFRLPAVPIPGLGASARAASGCKGKGGAGGVPPVLWISPRPASSAYRRHGTSPIQTPTAALEYSGGCGGRAPSPLDIPPSSFFRLPATRHFPHTSTYCAPRVFWGVRGACPQSFGYPPLPSSAYRRYGTSPHTSTYCGPRVFGGCGGRAPSPLDIPPVQLLPPTGGTNAGPPHCTLHIAHCAPIWARQRFGGTQWRQGPLQSGHNS